MQKALKPPSFRGLLPASKASSRAKRASSAHAGTRPEMLLRQALSKRGLRFRTNVVSLPGKPDIVFARCRVAVFCDGDFWHGRDWPSLRKKLKGGTNAAYWTAKIQSNMERDARNCDELRELGWRVVRLWESDIRADATRAAQAVERVVITRRTSLKKRQAHSGR
jgi:DNA mismatch endonuclease (patch repair protein)